MQLYELGAKFAIVASLRMRSSVPWIRTRICQRCYLGLG
jgi:hypothetical protein